ncbi:MAG: hypothetical protein MI723_01145 [Caulobacterales bacterium]|nr:hypothetical protein [Caulobacterales bacterium]
MSVLTFRVLGSACAALAVTGCAVMAGQVDDGGRAAREMQNAPVGDNDIVEPFGDPSITVIDQQVDTPLGGRASQPMRRDSVGEPNDEEQ